MIRLLRSILTIMLMLFTITSVSLAKSIDWDSLDSGQKKHAKYIYNIVQDKDVAIMMVAIAYQESRLGLTPVNLSDPGCGVFHTMMPIYLRKHKIKDTPLNRNIHCGKILHDKAIDYRTAFEGIEYWIGVHRNNKAKIAKLKPNQLTKKQKLAMNASITELVIRSYNKGFNYDVDFATKYYKSVASYISIVKRWVDEGKLSINGKYHPGVLVSKYPTDSVTLGDISIPKAVSSNKVSGTEVNKTENKLSELFF